MMGSLCHRYAHERHRAQGDKNREVSNADTLLHFGDEKIAVLGFAAQFAVVNLKLEIGNSCFEKSNFLAV